MFRLINDDFANAGAAAPDAEGNKDMDITTAERQEKLMQAMINRGSSPMPGEDVATTSRIKLPKPTLTPSMSKAS